MISDYRSRAGQFIARIGARIGGPLAGKYIIEDVARHGTALPIDFAMAMMQVPGYDRDAAAQNEAQLYDARGFPCSRRTSGAAQ